MLDLGPANADQLAWLMINVSQSLSHSHTHINRHPRIYTSILCIMCSWSLWEPSDLGHCLNPAGPQIGAGGGQRSEVCVLQALGFCGWAAEQMNSGPGLRRFRTIINAMIRVGPAILTFGQLILVCHDVSTPSTEEMRRYEFE